MREDFFEIFNKIGGEFQLSQEDFLKRLSGIKAFIFDWDGVFNDGTKNEQMTSLFSESDSMGTNLLRFAFWLDKGNLPPFALISGENNAASHRFAKRERINQCYFKFIDKTFAMADFCQKNGLEPHQIAFTFDDVIDFSIAKQCGLRFLIRRKSSPLTTEFAQKNALCDYVTAHEGGKQAVREVCELLIGAKNLFEKTVSERMAFGDVYKRYVAEKNSGNTDFYTFKDGSVVPAITE